MIKFGIVTEINVSGASARVKFDEDQVVSKFLPVLVNKSLKDKYFFIFDVNEQVVCFMDDNCEDGVILGAIYSTEDIAPAATADKSLVLFDDETNVEYDRSSHNLTVTNGTTELIVGRDGYTVKRGSETLKKLLEDHLEDYKNHTHSTGTGPSGPPLTATIIGNIKARVANLFKL